MFRICKMTTVQAKTNTQSKDQFVIAPVTLEEEGRQCASLENKLTLTYIYSDALIHARITNDERPLRRLTKKFHTFTSVAYPPIVNPSPSSTSSVEEMREAFLIELESFRLLLRKSRMVCDAERRQADTYRKERLRIGALSYLPLAGYYLNKKVQ